ncbi:hypothetical protein MPSEU_000378200 [Mayamaea pseudoterrestris]|nr:hypothetical protein MPSEU_000378200 [Mayamaea pseudoterrestris]
MNYRMLRPQLLSRCVTSVTKVDSRLSYPATYTFHFRSPMRNFLATPHSSFALRRRSKRLPPTPPQHDGDDDSEDDDNNVSYDIGSRNSLGYSHDAVTEVLLFRETATALIDKLYTALQPMEQVNDPFFLTKGMEDDLGPFLLIDFGPLQGQYSIQVDVEQSVVTMSTPRIGQTVYILSKLTNDWVSIADGHVLEGMLVRELLHHAQGLPKL